MPNMRTSHRPLKRSLNVRQLTFIHEYALTGNGRQSAIKAGYSAHSADALASNLLVKPKIKTELLRLKKEMGERFAMKVDNILEQLSRMVFADPREYVDAEGKQVSLHLLSDAAASALQSFETNTVGGRITRTKYKLVDKAAAIDKAMRHLGLFERDNGQAVSAIGNLMAEIHGTGSRLPMK